VDPNFLLRSSRIDVSKETKLAATSDELSAWYAGKWISLLTPYYRVDVRNATRIAHFQAQESTAAPVAKPSGSPSQAEDRDSKNSSFNFITECFFFTARAFHVGYLKAIQRYVALVRAQNDAGAQMTELANRRKEVAPYESALSLICVSSRLVPTRLLSWTKCWRSFAFNLRTL
jgi:hypothetical protein